MNSNRRTFLKQFGLGAAGLGYALSFPDFLRAQSAAGTKLPRSTPEAQGVPSKAILEFLEAIGKSQHEFHSFMFVRHGQVIAEGWWNPYRAELNHTLYSMSKSFTSTAVGLAVKEGKLTVNDLVASFFPDDLPEKVSENLAALRVKDLLSMSVGHEKDPTGPLQKEENWVKAFLSYPIVNKPGTVFLYDSGATYLLSAIVQKVSGQKVIDYLKSRLFEPLGIQGMTWEECPKGINTGGWGLNIQTEGLAKFGQLYLQKGVWKGKQLLPAEWIEEATTAKIQPAVTSDTPRLKAESDWHQGYCYQFWRSRHNAFRGDGAFGQYTLVLPEQDAVIAITSESSNMQGELNLIWDHLLPAMGKEPIAEDKAAQMQLASTLKSLALLIPRSQTTSTIPGKISGKTFKIDANEMKVEAMALNFEPSACKFTLKDNRGSYPIECGIDKWTFGDTNLPGTPPSLTAGGKVIGKDQFKIAAAYSWKDENTLEMVWRFYETPHHDTVTCHFEGANVKVEFMNSIAKMSPNPKDKRPVLQGQMIG